MKTEEVLEDIRSRVEAGYPLLFLKTAEENRWERAITDLTKEMELGFAVWTITRGLEPPLARDEDAITTATGFLRQLGSYPAGHLFLVKDFHPYFDDPVNIRLIRDLLPDLVAQKKTLLMFGPVLDVPLELEKDAVKINLPLPAYEDLQNELDELLDRLKGEQRVIPVLSDFDQDRLIKATMGLSANEAKNAWQRALNRRTKLDDAVFTTLIAEKRTLASGSDFLEFYDLEENVDDIGGLDQLKEWLSRRAEAYSPQAREQGVPHPKGVLLLGVQGCGKSLTARATARLFSFPLIRLDIATLLGAERGASERNMRDVLRLVESISPAVLWLDEIEKGFAGIEMDGPATADATMQRLVGTFLTWMAEIDKPIFVVATSNSVENLPPELLRRGRFDEIFFVDLPNFDERRYILEIHLKRRGWKTEQFDLDDIARRAEGFSGAELEQIVVTALIDSFGNRRVLAQDDLERAWRTTVPLSVTMEDKIFALRNWAQGRCRRATSDSRVTSMLEAERRHDAAKLIGDDLEFKAIPAWAQLAAAGQIKAGIVEFVRGQGDTLIPDLLTALEPYVEVAGEHGLAVRSNPNTVIWTGLSQSLSEMIRDLISSKRLYVHPTDVERYKAIQKGIRLPVLKEPTDDHVPRPMWMPSSFRTAPHPVHGGRLSRIGRMKLSSG